MAPTGTRGSPGIALKTEAIGLAFMLELPLVVVNVQRGGPSTGLPTKTEQADLLQAIHGRNGEAPMPVIAARSPEDCFESVYEACKIAIEHMTPVFFLSDGYIGNGSEPWKFPKSADLPEIRKPMAKPPAEGDNYLPYLRDEKQVREWALPGTKGLEHRIGGLEKEFNTGNISYEPMNHEKMVKVRQEKVDRIADFIPEIPDPKVTENGTLVVGWGSTFGAIETAVSELKGQGEDVGFIHLRYLNPFPKNLGELLKKCKNILVPELNNGQLVQLLRSRYLIDAKGLNKIRGLPFTVEEIKEAALKLNENG